MNKFKDLTGKRFGKLTVITRAENNKYNQVRWHCLCGCGNTKIITSNSLRVGTKSCGCCHSHNQQLFKDLTGETFGKLYVIKRVANDKLNKTRWLCKCKCGKEFIVRSNDITKGRTRSCGCSRKLQLQGKRFGRLIAIEITDQKSLFGQSYIWKCQCDCGNIKYASAAKLTARQVQSCGCLQKERSGTTAKLAYGEAMFNQLYSKYKASAKQRNLEFNLSTDQFKKLIDQHCFYCNKKPQQVTGKKRKANGVYVANGIDRLDSKKGYTITNCVPCCKKCNWMKGRDSVQDFLQHTKDIHTYQEKKAEHNEKFKLA